jgi:protocatechuate 3,4-dioxygenase beta subunit
MIALLVLLWFSQAAETARQDGCEIRGRVTDQRTGEPIAHAVVRIRSSKSTNEFTARTDDQGNYRIANLAPGEYNGSASAGEYRATHLMAPLLVARRGNIVLKSGDVVMGVNAVLPRALAMNIRVVDERGDPLSGMRVAINGSGTNLDNYGMFRMTDDLGRLRAFGLRPGQYIICAEAGMFDSTTSSGSAAREKFLRSCHPSVTAEAEAQPVQLGDSDLEEVVIQMRRGRTHTISGTVLDATGKPDPSALVTFNEFRAHGTSGSSVRVDSEGRFTVVNVLPGSYAIRATVGGPERPEHRRPIEIGFVPVAVGTADVEDVVVMMAFGVDVAGRVVFEEGEGKPSTNLLVSARLDGDTLPGSSSATTAQLDERREFVLRGMFGKRRLDVSNVPNGWYVKSIQYAGKEIIDAAVEFKAGKDPAALEVVLSTRGAFVTGRVVDERGAPAVGVRVYSILADPTERSRLTLGSSPVSAAGTYRLGPLRAGTYLVVAVPPGTSLNPGDRARLAELAEQAQRVTLAEIGDVTLDLAISGRF